MKKMFLSLVLFFILFSIACILTGCEKNEKIIVYIQDGMSDKEIQEMENTIKGIENVYEVQYTSKVEAYEVAKKKIGENVLEQYTEKNHPFPASFTITIKKDKKYDEIVKKIEKLNGVKEIGKKSIETKDIVNAELNYIKNNR